MSRTIHDLLDAIRLDEDHRFDVEVVRQGVLRRSRRNAVRRRAAVLVAAAGLAVLAAVVLPSVLLRQARSAPAGSDSTARPALSLTLRGSSSGYWEIVPAAAGEHLQIGYVRRVGEVSTSGSIEVYEPGAFDAASVQGGARTTVDGARAYYLAGQNPFNPDVTNGNGAAQPSIAWSYAPDAWAVVRIFANPGPAAERVPDELRQIAETVEIGEPEPVRLPFRVGYRPPGLRPVNVLTYDAVDTRRTVEYVTEGDAYDWRDPHAYQWSALRIAMIPAIPGQWVPDTTVGGEPAMRNGSHEVIVARGDQWITIGSGINVAPLLAKDVERIYAGLTFADWDDQGTWFEATTGA